MIVSTHGYRGTWRKKNFKKYMSSDTVLTRQFLKQKWKKFYLYKRKIWFWIRLIRKLNNYTCSCSSVINDGGTFYAMLIMHTHRHMYGCGNGNLSFWNHHWSNYTLLSLKLWHFQATLFTYSNVNYKSIWINILCRAIIITLVPSKAKRTLW